MLDRATLENFLAEQKTEHKHQVDFVKGLRTEYYKLCGEINKQDWKSMDSLLVLMDIWEKDLSLGACLIIRLDKSERLQLSV